LFAMNSASPPPGFLAALAERCAERLLYLLCRHCSTWRGVWRLNLSRRVAEFRFAKSGTLITETRLGFPIEVRKNDIIGHSLHFFGRYNAPLENVASAALRPGDCALDLGANIGAVTLHLARLVGPAGRVFAIEPMSANAGLLTRNVGRAGFEKMVQIEVVAAGRASRRAELFFDPGTSNWGAISLRDHTGTASEEIQIEPLDDLWKRWGRPHFRFVKMDVEGFESDVLAGAGELLATAPPEVWVVEFNPEQLAHTDGGAAQLWDAFATRGYRAFTKDGTPLSAAPHDHCDVVFRLAASSNAPLS
jgi:FkbM family methyltransferase